MIKRKAALVVAAMGVAGISTASADIVTVRVTGTVDWNQVTTGAFAAVTSGDPATLEFRIDSDVFTNSPSFPTRGYHIDKASFSLTMGRVTAVLADPFPGGRTPYFALRNNDPAVDGFMVTSIVDSPAGVSLSEPAKSGLFRNDFYVTYEGNMLSSLNVLDALGTYDYSGLTVFNWTVDDGAFQPIGINFEQMTIVALTSCYADCDQTTGPRVLDIFDFLCFQDSFVAGRKYACECDTSTGSGVCDIFDFLCFQDAFVAGCP